LKSLLRIAPILIIVDPNQDFIVCTDPYKEGLSGFLSQNGHALCYKSRKLKEHERNYVTHGLESTTIMHALNMWRHYLMGKRLELIKNHNGLKYLCGQSSLNARQRRWIKNPQ
jgi:hypothetical protein